MIFTMFEKPASVHRIGLALGLVCLLASAANAADPQPKGEREKMDEQVFGQLANAWTSLYDGKNADTVKQAEPLLKLNDQRYRWVAIEAAHLQARAYWGHGGRRGQAKARQLWKQLERIDTSNVTKLRLKIAQALELETAADDAKRNQAIALLEQILKDRQMNTATPEAGIDLARLYVQARRFDDAEKTLKFVIAFLGDKRTLIRMELPDEAVVQPYVKAAKAALARLKYERDAGREEFEAAEKLRKQEKWLQAARAYQAIVKDFAETDYAPRSELHIGDCLLGLGRESQAVAHWKKFIEPKPAGPWRAQAYIKIIDYCLEQQLDLPEAGKYAALARSSLPTALADEKAGESWQAAAFDVQLRVGLVSFCEGSLNKMAVAAEAFEAAKQLTSNKTTAERLDALIAAAKSGKGVIPEDCKPPASAGGATAAPADKAALALSMGVIHLVAGRLDNAEAFFCRVAGDPTSKHARSRRPMPGATKAQLAFATFGRGAVLQAHRKESEAKEQFLASIKAFSDGSWHDETLYRVATITQDLASAKFAKAPEPANPSAKPPAVSKAEPLTPQEREAAAKAEEERLAALLKAKGEALPYWQELIMRYPKSPRVEQAMYNAGVLLCELAEAAPAAEKAWKEAAFMLNRFCEFYPKSPLAGDAYVRQVDIALERLFDLKLALVAAQQAGQWAKDAASLPNEQVPLSAWTRIVSRPTNAELNHTAYECLLKAGLISYLAGQFDQAVEYIDAAGPKSPKEGYAEKPDLESIGLYYLLKAIRSKKSLTDQQALDAAKTDEQRLVLQLGDLYMESVRPDRAEAIFTRIIDRDPRLGQVPPDLEGYAMLQIATALDRQEGRRAEALDMLKKIAAKRELQGTYWGGCGLFRLALFTYNQTQDPKLSRPLYEQMLKEYPSHELTELAHLYLCLDAIQMKDTALAEKSSQSFLAKYPKSEYRALIQQRMDAFVKQSNGNNTR